MNQPTNIAASVRQKLTNLANERGADFQLLLIRYANERLLYRLSQSEFSADFVLKGATLFSVWSAEPHRATRDIDLLGFGEVSTQRLQAIFQALTQDTDGHDGLTFNPKSVAVTPIRKGLRYGGLRVSMLATLGRARIALQVDVGLGDAYRFEAVRIPPLLDQPAVHLRAYAKETVVAEKLEAMVSLGVANSRMKDFYDLAALAEDFTFAGQTLVDAVSATFGRRQTPFPASPIEVLTAALAAEPSKPRQWVAFVKRATPRNSWTLEEALAKVAAFTSAPLRAAAAITAFDKRWSPKGPWS